MSIDWYYANAGDRSGPVTEEEFFDLRREGQIGPQTLVWREGMSGWLPLSEAIVTLAYAPDTSSLCTICGRNAGPDDLISFHAARVCAQCKDAFFRRMREEGISEWDSGPLGLARVRYAGFWIRFLAVFLDGLIVAAVTFPLSIGFFSLTGWSKFGKTPAPDAALALLLFTQAGVMSLVLMVLQGVYVAWFISRRGGTPGKLVLGLRVIRPHGEKISFLRGFGRFFATKLSGLTAYIGYIMAAFDSEKQALHDRICDTRVIFKPDYSNEAAR